MDKRMKKGLTITAAFGLGAFTPVATVVAAPVLKNGWTVENGIQYFYKNGVKVRNSWAKDSAGKWCFLNALDGSRVREGWAKDSTGWCYIKDGYWVDHATWAKDSTGWQYIGSSGYWDSMVSSRMSNPVLEAETAVVKAESSKSQVDINSAKALISILSDQVYEKVALTQRINSISLNFQITDISVVDAKHINVVFSRTLNIDTAENSANYNFGNILKVNSARLQADGKTVVITLDDLHTLTNSTTSIYDIAISNIKDITGNTIFPYEKSLCLYDNSAPVIQSIKSDGEGIFQIKFSEPVKYSKAVNGMEIVDDEGKQMYIGDNLQINKDDPSILTILGISSDEKHDYTITISNCIRDYAGNRLADYKGEFSLDKDDDKPEVKSIKSESLKKLMITFSEPLDGDFTLYINGDIADAEVTPVSGTNGKSYYILFDDEQDPDDEYKVKVTDYRDYAGNEGESFSRYVKFNDEVPQLKSTAGTIKTYNGSRYAVFTYDMDVDDNINSSDITDSNYINSDGNKVSLDNTEIKSFKIYDASDDILDDYLGKDQFAISLDGLEIGKYTVTLPEGFAHVEGAESDETDVTFNVSEKTGSTDNGFINCLEKDKNKHDVYYVYFTEPVGSSALNPDNYMVGGKKIFGKAVYCYSDRKEVRLTVKQGAIANGEGRELSSDYRFTTSNIYDIYGNIVLDFDSHEIVDESIYEDGEAQNFDGIEFSETTGPAVKAAMVKDTKNVVVTFDEKVVNTGTLDAEDFAVTIDGATATISNVFTSDNQTFTLSLKSPINNYSKMQVGTSLYFDGEDKYGNEGIVNSTKTIYPY